MSKQITKVDKYEMIKTVLAKAGADEMLIDFCDNEIGIIKNKYATNKMKKENDKNAEYAELEKAVLACFEGKERVFNNDIPLDISTSKKTAIINRLVEKKLVVRLEKEKKKDPQSYGLAKKDVE